MSSAYTYAKITPSVRRAGSFKGSCNARFACLLGAALGADLAGPNARIPRLRPVVRVAGSQRPAQAAQVQAHGAARLLRHAAPRARQSDFHPFAGDAVPATGGAR